MAAGERRHDAASRQAVPSDRVRVSHQAGLQGEGVNRRVVRVCDGRAATRCAVAGNSRPSPASAGTNNQSRKTARREVTCSWPGTCIHVPASTLPGPPPPLPPGILAIPVPRLPPTHLLRRLGPCSAPAATSERSLDRSHTHRLFTFTSASCKVPGGEPAPPGWRVVPSPPGRKYSSSLNRAVPLCRTSAGSQVAVGGARAKEKAAMGKARVLNR